MPLRCFPASGGVRHSSPDMSSTALLSKVEFLRRIDPNQLALIFDFLPDVSFFMKDREGRFMSVNHRFCEYCGVRYEHQVLGKTDYDFFPKPRADAYRASDREVMRTGRALANRTHPAPEHEGSPHLVCTTKLPLRDARKRLVGIVGFSRRIEQARGGATKAMRLAPVIERMHAAPAEEHPTAELARAVGLSCGQFDRCFRETFGTSAHHYLLRVRVEAACRRLAESGETVSAIALECGFYDHSHFIRCFRQLMNTTPAAYRQAYQAPASD